MFFRKDIFNTKPAALEPEAETAEDEVRNPPSDTRPVYVIGDNALTCYLAAKLTDAGHDVIVIAGKENNLSFSTNGISLKEDSSLKLSRYKFNTSFWIKEEPKLVIIAANAGHVNASLAAVAKDKIGAAPVLCFTPLKDVNYIEAMVGGNLFQAFFDGSLQQNGQQVFLYGRTPQVKKLYAAPMNYRFPLQDEINAGGYGEANLISSVLMNAARSAKIRFMDSSLNKILKQIYNLILV